MNETPILTATSSFFFWAPETSAIIERAQSSGLPNDGFEYDATLEEFLTLDIFSKRHEAFGQTLHMNYEPREPRGESEFARRFSEGGYRRVVLHPDNPHNDWYRDVAGIGSEIPVVFENLNRASRIGSRVEELKAYRSRFGPRSGFVFDICHALEFGGPRLVDEFLGDREFVAELCQFHVSIPGLHPLHPCQGVSDIRPDHALCILRPSVVEPLLLKYRGLLRDRAIVLEGAVPPGRIDLAEREILWMRQLIS